MKLKSLTYLSTVFGLLAIVDSVWLSSLPDSMLTTSVEHRRGYFLLCISLGIMFLLQGAALLNKQEFSSRQVPGKIMLGIGIFCVLAGIRIAYTHMAGN